MSRSTVRRKFIDKSATAKAILQTKVNEVYLTDLTGQDITDFQNAGVNITHSRVKIIGINPNGSQIPINARQGIDLGNWGLSDLLWIDPNDPNTVQLFDIIDTLQQQGVTFEIGAIEKETPIEPQIPLHETFNQEFTIADYKATPLGKSVFIQIQVTKNTTEIFDKPVVSHLQIKRMDGTNILLETQQLDVKGATAFGVVYDIPDIKGITAIITVNHFIMTQNNIALSDMIQTRLQIDQTSPIVTPEKEINGDPLFKTLIGVFSTVTAIGLMATGRKR